MVVGVFEAVGVGDAIAEFDGVCVLEREVPKEFVDVAEADSVDVGDDVGVLVAEIDADAVDDVEGVPDEEGISAAAVDVVEGVPDGEGPAE